MLIEDLALHRQHMATIAKWHFDQWGRLTGCETAQQYISVLQQCVAGSGLPKVLVALAPFELLGSVSLVARDMAIRPELRPWLAQLFVAPSHRSGGIGRALVQAALVRAQHLGFDRLFLYTSGDLPRFYERLGWTTVETVPYLGKERTIMYRTTAAL